MPADETMYSNSMRVIGYLVVLGSLVFATAASAQTPPERVGFQMALRTGYAIPMGDVQEELEMSDFVSGQVPLFAELGAKVSPNFFVGGYLGLAVGGADGDLERACDAGDGCVSVGVRLGVEVQYHILPRGSVNPWLGYGIGLESLAISGGDEDSDDNRLTLNGFEYARLSGGLDFRLSKEFGVGPFVDYSIGEYTRFEIEGEVDSDGDIEEGAAHQWLTLGARLVIYP